MSEEQLSTNTERNGRQENEMTPERKMAAEKGWQFLSNHDVENAYAEALTTEKDTGNFEHITDEDIEKITQDKRGKFLEAITLPTEEAYEAWLKKQSEENKKLYESYDTVMGNDQASKYTPNEKTQLIIHGLSQWARENKPEIAETLEHLYAYADEQMNTSVDQFKQDWAHKETFGENKSEKLKNSLERIDSNATKRLALRALLKQGAESEDPRIQEAYQGIYTNIVASFKPARESDIIELKTRIEALAQGPQRKQLTELYANIVAVVKEHFPEDTDDYKKKRIQRARELLGTFVTPDENDPTKGILLDTNIEMSIEETEEEPVYNTTAGTNNQVIEVQELTEEEKNALEHEKNREQRYHEMLQAFISRLPEDIAKPYAYALHEAGFDMVRAKLNDSADTITIYLDPENQSLRQTQREEYKKAKQAPTRTEQRQIEQEHPWLKAIETTQENMRDTMRSLLTDLTNSTGLNSLNKRKLNTEAGGMKWHMPTIREAHAILKQLSKETGKAYATYIDANGTRTPNMNVSAIGTSGENPQDKSTSLKRDAQPNYQGFFSTLVLSIEVPKQEQT